MKCPVEIGHEISALRRVKVGEHGPVCCLNGRPRWSGQSKYRESFRERRRKRSRDGQAAEKMAGATGLWKRRNPANPAGFPLSHSLGDCGRLTKTGHFHLLRKGDISNVVRMGTFLSRNSPSETLRRSFKPRQQLR